jgi:hypothetical protein
LEDAVADQDNALRFDQAQIPTVPAAQIRCAACGEGLWDTYYEINGKVGCERCQSDVQLGVSQGSPVGRFLRAWIFGLGAGAVGAGIWYGVRAATGYEVGLIAIVVGVMVGGAVRKGARGRGGWLYQALAMFLTYAAIVSTYVPEVTKGVLSGIKNSKQEHAQAASAGTPAPAPKTGTPVAAVAAPGPQPVTAAEKPSLGRLALAVTALGVIVFAIALAAPFLAGLPNVVGLFIIAIGVYEAWKINRREPLTITGPYRVGAPAAETTAADVA